MGKPNRRFKTNTWRLKFFLSVRFILNKNLFEESEAIFDKQNRGFYIGDMVFETLKVFESQPILMEEHYFNLMASMRILRMKIPAEFTQEFFEKAIKTVLEENQVQNAKIRISVYRNSDHLDLIAKSSVSFLVEIEKVFTERKLYHWYNDKAEIDVFREFSINSNSYTQLNTHKPEDIIAQAYMQENDFKDLVLLNLDKKIARSILGSVFIVQGKTIKTPKISEGGIKSVTRNYLCKVLKRNPNFTFEETEIYPFELQKSDEVFVCIESEGILSIHKNRKKTYETKLTQNIVEWLNEY